MREGVQAEELALPRAIREQEVRIDNRRGKKPERDQVGQDVADVAKVHRQRRQQQGEAHRQDQLNQDDERKDRELAEVQRPLVIEEKSAKDDEPEEEVHHVRQDRDDRQHFRREQDLLDQVPA